MLPQFQKINLIEEISYLRFNNTVLECHEYTVKNHLINLF